MLNERQPRAASSFSRAAAALLQEHKEEKEIAWLVSHTASRSSGSGPMNGCAS